MWGGRVGEGEGKDGRIVWEGFKGFVWECTECKDRRIGIGWFILKNILVLRRDLIGGRLWTMKYYVRVF